MSEVPETYYECTCRKEIKPCDILLIYCVECPYWKLIGGEKVGSSD